MKKLIISGLFVFCLFGCDEDELMSDNPTDDNTDEPIEGTEFEAYEEEVFEDLTLTDFEEINTPYEEELSALSGARVLNNIDELAEMITQLFDATLIEAYEDEARGLSVYVIKVLFADGTVVNVTVVQDIFEILSIEAIVGSEISDEVSTDGFISLSDAIEAAKAQVDGDIVRWEISIEENNTLEYELHVVSADGTRYEVELDGTDGEVLAIKVFEAEDAVLFEEEAAEEIPEVTSDISDAVANFITGNVIFADTETDAAGTEYWNVLLQTSSEALVSLKINSATLELTEAEGTVGPFDYEMSFLENGVSFSDQLATVEGQMSVEVTSWTYTYIQNTEFSYWALSFYAEDEADNITTVVIHAASGEWVESSTTPSEDFVEHLATFISGEIGYAYRYDNDGNPFWEIQILTASGEAFKLLVFETTYELLSADPLDNDGDGIITLDQELSFGGSAALTSTEAITKAEEELADVDAEAYDWTYHHNVEVDNESYRIVTISLSDPNFGFYVVWIDVDTGDIVKTES